MRSQCPHCLAWVRQTRNLEGPNFCPFCHKLFVIPRPKDMPPWILGVVAFLIANLQLISHHSY